jgi:hypothetical protein
MPRFVYGSGVECSFASAGVGNIPLGESCAPRVGCTKSGAGGPVSERAVLRRAYSSIGQSPRLITGLLLVRTQLGPLTPTWRRFTDLRDLPFFLS